MPVPNIIVDDPDLEISGLQWSIGMPALQLDACYTGSQLSVMCQYQASDQNEQEIQSGCSGTLAQNLRTHQSVNFTPQTKAQVRKIRFFIA